MVKIDLGQVFSYLFVLSHELYLPLPLGHMFQILAVYSHCDSSQVA
jgi:hypothetical protein